MSVSSVNASFLPDRVTASPGETAALTLQLVNPTDAERVVKLRAGGGLADQTVLQTETIYLDPNETFEVPVIVDAKTGLPAGVHSCVIEVDTDGEKVNAAASVEILATADFSARLEPLTSQSARQGRHRVVIDNSGNTPLLVELAALPTELVEAELAVPAINVDPGASAKVELRLTPHHRFWNGSVEDHPFTVEVVGSNGEHVELSGIYEQGPRLRPWFLPAFAGMVGALLLGTLAWFLLLKPAVEDIASDEAAELDLSLLEQIDERVAAMEAAAEEASELPLGEPTDLRLDVTADAGATATQTFVFDESGSGRVLSISDVIFQNPFGATGSVELLRDDDVLLRSSLANFRDLDFHLVAPFRIDSRSEIGLRVTCDTPGPGTAACEVGATVTGFVDDT